MIVLQIVHVGNYQGTTNRALNATKSLVPHRDYEQPCAPQPADGGLGVGDDRGAPGATC